MLKIALCDDQEVMIDQYEEWIREVSKKHQIHMQLMTYKGSSELLFDLEDKLGEIDIIYMDVEMPKINGIELGKRLRKMNYAGEIIYLSSHRDFVFSSFDVNPANYLVKGEVTIEKFEEVFLGIIKQRVVKNNDFISFKTKNGVIRIKQEDIYYFEIIRRVVGVHCKDQKIEFYGTFEKLLEQINTNIFVRAHRGYIVNILWVRAIKRNSVELLTEVEIPVGRKYITAVREAFEENLYKSN